MATIKKLEEGKLNKLQTAEKEIGCCLVAFDTTPKPASISDSQIEKVRSLEKELDAVIVAYECK